LARGVPLRRTMPPPLARGGLYAGSSSATLPAGPKRPTTSPGPGRQDPPGRRPHQRGRRPGAGPTKSISTSHTYILTHLRRQGSTLIHKHEGMGSTAPITHRASAISSV
jgi:hypothetical protein